jgi:hypothetical protein
MFILGCDFHTRFQQIAMVVLRQNFVRGNFARIDVDGRT